MKIDTHNGWFKGLGDIVCFAWIGATLQAAGAEAEFYAYGWRAEVLRMLPADRDGGCHRRGRAAGELRDGCAREVATRVIWSGSPGNVGGGWKPR